MLRSPAAGRRRLWFWLPLAALGVTFALAGCASGGPAGGMAVASVNGHGIALNDFQQAVRYFAVAQNQQQVSDIPWQTVTGRENLAAAQTGALSFLVNVDLIHEQAAACHANVTSTDVAKQRADLEKQLKSGANNPSVAPLIPVLTPRMIDLFAQVSADEAALTNTVSAPSAHLRQIVVASQSEATQIEQQAKQGADFGQLAKQHSLDSTSAASGGEVGTFAFGELSLQSQAFEQQVFSGFTPVVSGGCYGQNHYADGGVRYIITPGSNNQYVLYQAQLSDQPLKSIKDSQTQSTAFGAWLLDIVRANTNVTTYLAAPTTQQGTSGQ